MGIVGVVAFLMAIQPFIQMFFNHPSVRVLSATKSEESSRSLGFVITARPITNRILGTLGIRRPTPEGAIFRLTVTDLHTMGNVLDSSFVNTDDGEGHILRTPDLHPTMPVFLDFIATHTDGTTNLKRGQSNAVAVTPGEYNALLEVIVETSRLSHEQPSRVGTAPSDLYWLPPTKS